VKCEGEREGGERKGRRSPRTGDRRVGRDARGSGRSDDEERSGSLKRREREKAKKKKKKAPSPSSSALDKAVTSPRYEHNNIYHS
jgi:hypothetical protein